MSLYADYVKERLNKSTIESEHGFVVFQLFDEDVYIEDVYIAPEQRSNGLGRIFIEAVNSIAKDKGKKYLTTTVRPSAAGSTHSLKCVLGVGFELYSATQDAIFFRKEVI